MIVDELLLGCVTADELFTVHAKSQPRHGSSISSMGQSSGEFAISSQAGYYDLVLSDNSTITVTRSIEEFSQRKSCISTGFGLIYIVAGQATQNSELFPPMDMLALCSCVYTGNRVLLHLPKMPWCLSAHESALGRSVILSWYRWQAPRRLSVSSPPDRSASPRPDRPALSSDVWGISVGSVVSSCIREAA